MISCAVTVCISNGARTHRQADSGAATWNLSADILHVRLIHLRERMAIYFQPSLPL